MTQSTPERDMVRRDRLSSTEQLWLTLPAIYRERDAYGPFDRRPDEREAGDLLRYLSGFGEVLDRVRKTLDQRLLDISPLTCQTWLLPYFADLLDVRPLSPSEDGQRQEIANAVRWRQRKGTVPVCVEIAEAVCQAPMIAFEGHRSVARTPVVGYRQRTMDELGEVDGPDQPRRKPEPHTSDHLATRPGTPAVTVDFRKLSHPRRLPDTQRPTSLSVQTRFGDEEVVWQAETAPHGVPCHVGGYRDVTMRIPDMRSPDWHSGHHHPKRFRLYTPVFEGFIKAGLAATVAHSTVALIMQPVDEAVPNVGIGRYEVRQRMLLDRYLHIEERLAPADKSGEQRIRSTLLTIPTLPADMSTWDANWPDNPCLVRAITGKSLARDTVGETAEAAEHRFAAGWNTHWNTNGFLLQWERWCDEAGHWQTEIRGGTWNAESGCPGTMGMPVDGRDHLNEEARWPAIAGNLLLIPPDDRVHHVKVQQLVVMGTLRVTAKRCDLSRLSVSRFEQSADATAASPHVVAADCLIHTVGHNNDLTVELEYCTVSSAMQCQALHASDCILLGSVERASVPELKLRYTCAPLLQSGEQSGWLIHDESVHRRWPDLYGQQVSNVVERSLDAAAFGERGYGVIKQSSHASIRHGAEDGGELGAFHNRHYCGRQDAVVEKLNDFLPLGMKPVVIVDEYWQAPLVRPAPEQE